MACFQFTNQPLPLHVLQEHQLHPIEVQYGLLQVAEGLDFLHSSVKMIHGNLCPSNIVVTSRGAWKLLGFNFCCFSQYQTDAQVRVNITHTHTHKKKQQQKTHTKKKTKIFFEISFIGCSVWIK